MTISASTVTTRAKHTASLEQQITMNLDLYGTQTEKPSSRELNEMVRGFEVEANGGFTSEEMESPECDPSILDPQFMLPINTSSSKSVHGRSGVRRR